MVARTMLPQARLCVSLLALHVGSGLLRVPHAARGAYRCDLRTATRRPRLCVPSPLRLDELPSADEDAQAGTPDPVSSRRGRWKVEWFRGVRDDFARKAPFYASDWKDGLNVKSVAAIGFLFFASLASVVAFGGAMSQLTAGAMGVAEVLASCGGCGE